MRERLEKAMDLTSENSTRENETRVPINVNKGQQSQQSGVTLTQRESEMMKPIFSRSFSPESQVAKFEALQDSIGDTIAELRAELARANMPEDRFL